MALIAVIVIVVALTGGGDDESGGGGSGGGTGGGEASGYTQEVEEGFVSECTSQAATQAQCECAWDGVVEQIPFERFAEIEDDIAAERAAGREPDPTAYPELVEVMSGCVTAT